MDKTTSVEELKAFRNELSSLQSACQAVTGTQIQARATLMQLEILATRWFEHVEPTLRRSFGIEEATTSPYRDRFGKLLELSATRPSRQLVTTILQRSLRDFHAELIVPVQKFSELEAKYPSLDQVLVHASGTEAEYLQEAVDCARLGKLRAAIILGWAAAVDRLHRYVQTAGFDQFNNASTQMAAITTGRYRKFNKKFDVHNLAELRMSVFDGDLLWILEFMGAIDGNQHEKLGICFTMRNTSAHPGEAAATPENVLSFFSDLDALVLANPKFTIV